MRTGKFPLSVLLSSDKSIRNFDLTLRVGPRTNPLWGGAPQLPSPLFLPCGGGCYGGPKADAIGAGRNCVHHKLSPVSGSCFSANARRLRFCRASCRDEACFFWTVSKCSRSSWKSFPTDWIVLEDAGSAARLPRILRKIYQKKN